MTHADASVRRHAAAHLSFAVGGGRTMLARQHVPYPFHITRPFRLDAERRDLATLYLQSAAGGLYRGDDLTLRVDIGDGAAAHLVTQAATVVHDTGSLPARQRVEIKAGCDAFIAYTPDPLVLFPNAAIANETFVELAPGARVILSDAFAPHDPRAHGRPFASILQRLEIATTSGRLLVRETGRLAGAIAASSLSPLFPFSACGTLIVLAPGDVLPSAGALREAAEIGGTLAGVTTLPNAAGVLLRCLGKDGGDVRRGLEAAFAIAFAALAGVAPAPRRR